MGKKVPHRTIYRSNVCERCGKVYQSARCTSRYCSTTCRVAAFRERKEEKKKTKARTEKSFALVFLQ